MPIKIHDSHKSEYDQEADAVADYAGQIKRFRKEHREPDDRDISEVKRLHDKLEEHVRDLKNAIYGYYGL